MEENIIVDIVVTPFSDFITINTISLKTNLTDAQKDIYDIGAKALWVNPSKGERFYELDLFKLLLDERPE